MIAFQLAEEGTYALWMFLVNEPTKALAAWLGARAALRRAGLQFRD